MKVLFLMLAGLSVAMAAANEPSAAALDFLEKVRLGTVDLEPGKGTALSPNTIAEKRHEISRRLERMAGDVGKGKLEAGEVKIDDDLAAVLVRDSGGFDPTRMRVFAIGLVKIKDQWLPAPLPSSFENTGFGFANGVRQRIAALENWMMRGQVTDLENLRERATEQMKQSILTSLDPEILRDPSAGKVLEKFFDACAKRDLPAMLGFLGGLQNDLPDDWSDRLHAADEAVTQGKFTAWPWRLLVAPEVLRLRVESEEEDDGAVFSYGCIDPAGHSGKMATPQLDVIDIALSKDGSGLWKIDLPTPFFTDEETDEEIDPDFLEPFLNALRKQTPEESAADVRHAAVALGKALEADNLKPLLSLMSLEGSPEDSLQGITRAAQMWWLLHGRSTPRHAVTLGAHEVGNAGIVTFQFFSPLEPDRFDLKSFYFEKSPEGWLLVPGLKPSDSFTDDQNAVKAWTDEQAKIWKKSWQSNLLINSQSFDTIQAGKAPSAEEARKLVEAWLAATRRNDIDAALGLTAWISRPGGSSRLLQNLGYELGSASREDSKAAITTIQRGETWTAVGVKSEGGDSTVFPLYLAIATPAGPRLLIETDLFGNASSGRQLLNKAALGRVKDFSTPEISDELGTLFEKYQQSLTTH